MIHASSSPTTKQLPLEGTPLLGKKCSESQQGQQASVSLSSAFATAVAAALLYLMASSSMIMANKYLMSQDRFPFATTLTILHQLGTFALAICLWLAWPSLFPAANRIIHSTADKENASHLILSSWLPYAPTGALFAVALITSNKAYVYASVAFLQMMKEGFVLIVYVLSVIVGLEALRLRSVVVLVCVACCAAAAVYGEIHFSWPGFWLQLTAGFSPATLLALLPLQVAFWDAKMLTHLALWWPQVLGSVFIAFLLQIATAMAIASLNGTGFGLTSVFKDVSIVFVAGLVFKDTLTWLQLIGFLGAVGGIGLYAYMKQFPSPENPATCSGKARAADTSTCTPDRADEEHGITK